MPDETPTEPDAISSDPSTDTGTIAEALTEDPEFQEAYEKAFGEPPKEEPTARTSRRSTPRSRIAAQEEAESLASIGESEETEEGEEFAEPEDQKASEALEQEQLEEAGVEGEGGEAGEQEEESTLPWTLRHAAHRAGLKDEEIDPYFKHDPAAATRHFEQLYHHYNELTARYAAMGQQQGLPAAPPQGRPARGAPAQQPPAGDVSDSESDTVDALLQELYGDEAGGLQEMGEKYGKDFLEEIVRPMLRPVAEMYRGYQQQQSQVLATEIGQFFANLPAEFADMYGQAGQVTDEQYKTRLNVAAMADYIRDGAGRQGVNLTVSDGLERAHMYLASERISEVERKRIIKQVKDRRSDRRTSRPTNHQRASTFGPPSLQSAMDAYQRRAEELDIL